MSIKKISNRSLKFINGAHEGIFYKLFDSLYSELKQKEDVINSFVAQLRYTAKFDEKLKERFLTENSYRVDNQTYTNKE
jgi:hypothetical protein